MAEIRAYEVGDYADVCRIFKEGMHENWWPAYRSHPHPHHHPHHPHPHHHPHYPHAHYHPHYPHGDHLHTHNGTKFQFKASFQKQ